MNNDKLNAAINDTKTKLKRVWDENPVICIVLGIAAANASAKLMQANSDRKRTKTYDREVRRRERMNASK